jgi:hypothetical protein
MATSVSGWSTTASRVDAVREHQAAGTGCAETMRPVLDSLTKPALDALLASLAHVLRLRIALRCRLGNPGEALTGRLQPAAIA